MLKKTISSTLMKGNYGYPVTMVQKNSNTAITVVEDFKSSNIYCYRWHCALTTPPSDVLKYTLADGSAVRPSGTEPKIKIYIAVVGESNEDSQNQNCKTCQAETNAFCKIVT